MTRSKRSRPSPSQKATPSPRNPGERDGARSEFAAAEDDFPLLPRPTGKRPVRTARRALAALELALLLPMLVFMFAIAADWARIFYYSVTLTNAARQGAIYGANLTPGATSPYTSVEQAAKAELVGLTPQPTVTWTSTNPPLNDAAGNPYIEVTVAWQFSTVTRFPGVPSPVNLTRKVRMRVAPQVPY